MMKVFLKPTTILLLIFSSFMSVGWGQDCVDGVEVELWGECYNIEETDTLNLSGNGLTGEIPVEIGNLTNLTYLNLRSNQLTGEIPPEIGQLTSLTYLYLSYNQLSGEIPPEIGQLTSLTYLNLRFNQLSGEIPSEIGNLMNLRYLRLYNNQLSGEIPPEIGQLTSLTTLYLYNNQLSGEIPSEIGNLTNLEWLSLTDNQLTGSIPSEIGNLTNLTFCDLYSNQFTSLPNSVCNLMESCIINISDNLICSEFPSCINWVNDQDCGDVNCPNSLTEINGDCFYQSDIDVIENLNLTYLDVNYFDGRIISLNLSGRQLTTIPESIWNLDYLRRLMIHSNQLTGSIPSEVGNLTQLIYLNLSNNQFSGDIPVQIGDLVNLKILDLETNQLSSVPESIGDLSNLKKLNLSSNQLTSLPESICDLNVDWNDYNYFLCGDNYICEEIPECIENTVGFNYSYDWDSYERIYNPQDTTNCISMSVTDDLIPTTYNLSSPYPNPFNPTTTISFSIPQLGMVSLNVYDITGKLITTLINKQLNIGYHSIDWDGTNQSSGMYFVRMESGEYVKIQKLLLVK